MAQPTLLEKMLAQEDQELMSGQSGGSADATPGPPATLLNQMLAMEAEENAAAPPNADQRAQPSGALDFLEPMLVGAAKGAARGVQAIPELATGDKVREQMHPAARHEPEFITQVLSPFTDGSIGDLPLSKRVSMMAGLIATISPQAQVNVIKSTFPQAEPETDDNGITTIKLGDERIPLNQPGFSMADIASPIALMTAFYPGTVFARGGPTLAARIMRGGLADFLTSITVDKAAQKLGSGEGPSLERAAGSAAFGRLSDLAMARRAHKINKQADQLLQSKRANVAVEKENVKQAREIMANTPMKTMTSAMQNENARALERQAMMGQTEPGAPLASRVFGKINEEAGEAVEWFKDKLSSSENMEDASNAARVLVGKARGRLVRAREIASDKFYNAARKQDPSANIRPTLKRIDNLLEGDYRSPKSAIHRKLVEVYEKIDDAGFVADAGYKPAGGASNIGPLHVMKKELDSMIEAATKNSRNDEARVLGQIKKSLVGRMALASKNYGKGLTEYEKASGPINQFDAGLGGQIHRLGDASEETVQTLGFKSVRKMRQFRNLLDKEDPSGKTFDAMVRERISERLKTKVPKLPGDKPTGKIVPANDPAHYANRLFGDASERQMLRQALRSDEMRQNFTWLERGLRKQSSGHPGGSQTWTRQDIEKELRGGVKTVVRASARNPWSTLVGAGEEADYRNAVRVMAEMAYNTRWVKDVSRARKASNNPPLMARLINQLAVRIGTQLAQEAPERTEASNVP